MEVVDTIEKARALPEIDDEMFKIWLEVEPDGRTIKRRKVRPFVVSPHIEKEIAFFVDSDGRLMKVCYTEDGPAKVRFW